MTGVAKQSFASPFIRTSQKKTSDLFKLLVSNEVRIKGLEPPRLSASDPKSDVATNYTISAGSCKLKHLHRGRFAVQIYILFILCATLFSIFLKIFHIFVF